ncbi:MAG: transposase [Dactylosporangium sp.]|nr:transposase [Dactylosporangium sp.]
MRSSDKPVRQIARDLGVSPETLRGWIARAKRRSAVSTDPVLSSDERDELRKLRARVRERELEKDMLRKAAQCFAKEVGHWPAATVASPPIAPSTASSGSVGCWGSGGRATTRGWPPPRPGPGGTSARRGRPRRGDRGAPYRPSAAVQVETGHQGVAAP